VERRLTHYQNIPGSSSDVEAWYLYDGAGNRVQQAVLTGTGTATTTYLPSSVEEVRPEARSPSITQPVASPWV
jgi:hypothetical protein